MQNRWAPSRGSRAVAQWSGGAACIALASCTLPIELDSLPVSYGGASGMFDAATADEREASVVDMDAGAVVLPVDDAGIADAFVPEAVKVSTRASEATNCRSRLAGRLRDFEDWHPDFAVADAGAHFPGAVQERLGPGGSPAYVPDGGAALAARPDTFTDWFHDRQDINRPRDFAVELQARDGGGLHFRDVSFFPADEGGAAQHNHYFTYELHGTFDYRGGESLTITADDDLWAFVNGHLLIDLGGVHAPMTQEAALDSEAERLQLRVGASYRMDIFGAQRRSPMSVLSIDTNVACIRP